MGKAGKRECVRCWALKPCNKFPSGGRVCHDCTEEAHRERREAIDQQVAAADEDFMRMSAAWRKLQGEKCG